MFIRCQTTSQTFRVISLWIIFPGEFDYGILTSLKTAEQNSTCKYHGLNWRKKSSVSNQQLISSKYSSVCTVRQLNNSHQVYCTVILNSAHSISGSLIGFKSASIATPPQTPHHRGDIYSRHHSLISWVISVAHSRIPLFLNTTSVAKLHAPLLDDNGRKQNR
jgi:hypothetical protein